MMQVNTGPSFQCSICHQTIPTGFGYVEHEGIVLVLPGDPPNRVRGIARMHAHCVELFDPEKPPETV
jgi:hypothetical protein